MSNNQADNITMSGGGLYSLATRGAKDVIDLATPRVLAAVDSVVGGNPGHRFVFADMGCADGGTSLDMVRSVLGRIEALSQDTQSIVIYADQPANDFNALVSIIHARTQFDAWIEQFQNAYPLFSGASFYLQTVPDNTLDFAFSATAMHWLSAKPCNISEHVHMVGASGDEAAAFSAQAKNDWHSILMARAKELKSGGKMVLVNFCRDENGQYLGNTGGVNMFNTLNEIWLEFLAKALISEQEYHNMTLPQYYNTVAEFSAPLLNPDNPCYQAGLWLDSIETAVVACPFAVQFQADHDAKQFADGLIASVRSWNQSIFAAGLDQSRAAKQRAALIEDYYHAYHQRVLNAPAGHGMGYVHAYMTISKL